MLMEYSFLENKTIQLFIFVFVSICFAWARNQPCLALIKNGGRKFEQLSFSFFLFIF